MTNKKRELNIIKKNCTAEFRVKPPPPPKSAVYLHNLGLQNLRKKAKKKRKFAIFGINEFISFLSACNHYNENLKRE